MMIAEQAAKFFNESFQLMHTASWNAGWWHDPELGDLKSDNIIRYVVPTKIALIHSEISEGLEGYRKDKMDDKLPNRKMLEVELADAVIRIGDLAGALGLDVGGAIIEKMAFNRVREDHQPGNRYQSGGKSF